MTTRTATKASAKTSARRGESDASGQWTADEVNAMKDHTRELKAAKRRGGDKAAEGEADLQAKIGEMKGSDRKMAERIHEIVKATAPELESRTWYGMPAYALNGRVLCFFQAAAKFKSRYATFGFNEDPRTDEGTMWATSWALTDLTEADEKKIAALVKKAVG